ncbi:ArsR family transcriptional regulator [Sphingobacterium sp. DR205]|uniref:ArsR family transcriptional regulator n=1 Tax=Sphingobacterium sp. DR205 TaxID=2713573 RepID=UPI0013E4EC21|nr:ArsR family transcriptional regulator [Sphingobacterium sp. DR205]QIH31560.1 ArsR family transcriptional regulator [Sphingobacterium sp. DR205]
MLDSLITSKTRLKLLIKFFVSASNRGYLRGLADEFKESTNSIRKELNQLTEAGYLIREESDNKIFYRVNVHHSLFSSLSGLIHKFLGIEVFVDKVLERAGDVEEVALLGDYAQGIDSGHIEVLIKGNNLDKGYLEQASIKAGTIVDKKVTVYTNCSNTVHGKIVLYQKKEVL